MNFGYRNVFHVVSLQIRSIKLSLGICCVELGRVLFVRHRCVRHHF